MSDWRYWITYEGRIQAEDEEHARLGGMADHLDRAGYPDLKSTPTVEVEEVGEGE